jgi:hypothetical protein
LQRILSTAVIVGLLVATAAAFAITERLKLTKSPISATKVLRDHVSPRAKTTVAIRVRFRRSDVVSASILDSHRREVDTLMYRIRSPRGWKTFVWSGLDDAGHAPADGTYHLEIHFANQHRTILLPNPLVLETKSPVVLDAGVTPKVFSPDGDGQSDHTSLHYRVNEEAHVLVYLNGRRIIHGRSHKERDKVSWGGTVRGKALPAGTYVLTVGAVDLAGNVAKKTQRVAVTIRYIALAAKRVTVRPGSVLRIGVSTDAKRYRWTLGARSGFASARLLRVRVPSARGTYRLVLTEHGHTTAATVVVE